LLDSVEFGATLAPDGDDNFGHSGWSLTRQL
jgi:hypothetical protein